MKEKHNGAKRGFYWTNKAWYCIENKPNEIIFGLYHYDKFGGDDGTTGEMQMLWEDLSGKDVPQLRVYDDAWSVLSMFHDVVDRLAEYDNENITPEQFIEVLRSCGFNDCTAYDVPGDMKNDREAIKLRNRLNEIEAEAEVIKEKLHE